MAWLATFALIVWLPVVFFLFEKYTVQKAIVFSFVAAWLFLPPIQIELPGFPDWSKMTATVVSVSICTWLKASGQIHGLRFRWYDLPVLVYCLCPFAASITNNLGAYDGLSAVLDELMRWGLPYVIGRAFLANAAGNRQLALGMAVGGMLYVPFCLFEIRMSPMLKIWVFGFGNGRAVDFGFRYGGYRPMVFLSTGLELGWWMCCATLAAFMLWKSGAVKRLYGYPMAVPTAILAVVTVACKSTGALLQIMVGFLLIYFTKWTGKSVLVWALMAIGPFYCATRPSGLFTGEQVVSTASSLFGADRAQSLEYRFEQEEILMRSALQRPLLGWARSGGFNPPDASGKTAITDGLWIIVFGWMGLVGLAALNLMLLIPTALFLIRFRPKTWFDPDVAPATTLAIILPLFMVDNLSNAMLNPIYAIAMGAVAGYLPRMQAPRRQPHAPDLQGHASEPNLALAPAGRRVSRNDLTQSGAADRLEAEAAGADEQGWLDEANEAYFRAIRCRHASLGARPTPAGLDRLARSHVLYARFLTRIDRVPAAIQQRNQALAVWSSIPGRDQAEDFSHDVYAANLNDLAWLLVGDAQAGTAEVERAIHLSEEAVTVAPDHAPFWNTLGIARYRHDDYHKAIHALSRSVSLSDDGGNAFDFYYLALANHALNYPDMALGWVDRAEAWARAHPDLATLLGPVQAEVATKLSMMKITG